ncbi:MAG: phosphotransferase [Kordiimonadaceae bacterium]|jgi:Ser/Thr protein kinase RdoA (MazF antagonist)|nr:phosphotransferase [Kordiimonadaceae bacterium]MBT6031190.1 phosphotransferase [Kordiimonadaceae bacterium]
MEVFESKPPAFTDDQLCEILKTYFDREGDIKALVSERDQNARLISDDGEYVLKIANIAENKKFIEFQNAVLNHIAKFDPDLAVPVVIKGANGAEIFDHLGHSIRLISFLKGDIFNSAPKSTALYEDLGCFLGRFSKAMIGFDHAQAHQPEFLWNLDNALFTKQYIDDIENDENRELIKYFYNRYETKVAPRLKAMRSAVIHSDANDFNVVAQGDKISGLIDFGDMLYAKQVNELAISLGYVIMDVDDLYNVSNAMISSYTQVFALTEDELEVLFDLAAMRLVMSVCISSNRAIKASSEKHKEYLLITQAPALRTLRRLKDIDMSSLSSFAKKAGGFKAA